MRSILPKIFLLLLCAWLGSSLYSQCTVTISCPPSVIVAADTTCAAVVSYAMPTATNSCTQSGSTTFNYTGALQTFTVPVGVTSIHIDGSGAQGGSVTTTCAATGGLGARMQGDFAVTPGEVLSILVGQQGFTNGADAGGGGGSFVVRTGNVPLLVAGGGGGATNNISSCGNNRNGLDATITTSGTASANGLVAGGTAGNGGGASTGSGSGGGGFLTDGANGAFNSNGGGKSYVNGGAGGTGLQNNHGGYGGGGCGWQTGGNGGGGGGYSGGGTSGSQPYTAGGGGGSYSIGTNQVNTAGFQTGNGRVILTYNVPAPAYTSMMQGLPSGSSFPSGTTTIVYMATDSLGASDSCSFTVTVNDSIAPGISCPPSDTMSNDPGTCGAVVTYASPTATDACPGVWTSLMTGLASGSAFPQGTTNVTYMAQDSGGNTATCNFDISVIVDDASAQSIDLCAGESYTIGNNTYTQGGTYVDTLLNGGGCDSVVTTTISVAAPINTGTTVNGGTISADESLATYQWLNCDSGVVAIPGATSQSFTPAQSGSYAVVVSVGNCADTSACDVVVGIASGFGSQYTVYPNPSSGRVQIAFGQSLDLATIEVHDLSGKRLRALEVRNVPTATLDLSTLPEGMYILKVSTGQGQAVFNWVKRD